MTPRHADDVTVAELVRLRTRVDQLEKGIDTLLDVLREIDASDWENGMCGRIARRTLDDPKWTILLRG